MFLTRDEIVELERWVRLRKELLEWERTAYLYSQAMPLKTLDELIAEAEPYDGRPAGVSCGIYFLFGASKELLYVGQSKEISHRLRAHFLAASKPFRYFSCVAVNRHFLDDIEGFYIETLEPPMNVACSRCMLTDEQRRFVARRLERSAAA